MNSKEVSKTIVNKIVSIREQNDTIDFMLRRLESEVAKFKLNKEIQSEYEEMKKVMKEKEERILQLEKENGKQKEEHLHDEQTIKEFKERIEGMKTSEPKRGRGRPPKKVVDEKEKHISYITNEEIKQLQQENMKLLKSKQNLENAFLTYHSKEDSRFIPIEIVLTDVKERNENNTQSIQETKTLINELLKVVHN